MISVLKEQNKINGSLLDHYGTHRSDQIKTASQHIISWELLNKWDHEEIWEKFKFLKTSELSGNEFGNLGGNCGST